MIIDTATLWLFAAASLALFISPGPDMIYIAARSIGQGRRAGAISGLGISGGIVVHMLAAAFGLAGLLQVFPQALLLIKWGGVAYLIYLGLKALFGREEVFELTPKTARRTAWRLFSQGVLCNVTNPKVALFFLAFLPLFTSPERGDITTQMLFYGGLFCIGGTIGNLILAYFFGGVGNWLAQRPSLLRLQRWITGGSMLGLAALVALDVGGGRRP